MRSHLKKGKSNRFATRDCGSALIEVPVSFFLMIVMAAWAADLTLMMFGMSLNDLTCRDAARAAAEQSSPANALSAAQAQLAVHATDGVFVSQPTLVSSSSPNFVYNDYSGSPPTNQSPYVTVTTAVNIKLPAPIVFFGVKFMPGNSIQFTRRYTYPIIKEKFYG